MRRITEARREEVIRQGDKSEWGVNGRKLTLLSLFLLLPASTKLAGVVTLEQNTALDLSVGRTLKLSTQNTE